MAASKLPAKTIFNWILAVEDPKVSFDDLAEDVLHPVLGAKLAAGVQAILHGPLGQERRHQH